jgi:hypothetical protein
MERLFKKNTPTNITSQFDLASGETITTSHIMQKITYQDLAM